MWIIALVIALGVVALVALLARRPTRTRGDAETGRRSAGPDH